MTLCLAGSKAQLLLTLSSIRKVANELSSRIPPFKNSLLPGSDFLAAMTGLKDTETRQRISHVD